jgi:hypothetical protein
MRRWILVGVCAGSLFLAFATSNRAQVAGLSVEQYCELSIVRLEFARDLWAREGRGPNTFEEATLWPWYGTNAAEFYAFAGAHRKELAAYLAAHPEVQAEIDRLRARIDALTAQAEAQ